MTSMNKGAAIVDVMIASTVFVASFLAATKLYYSTFHSLRLIDHFTVLTLYSQHASTNASETTVSSMSGNDTISLTTHIVTTATKPDTIRIRHEITPALTNAMLDISPLTTERTRLSEYDTQWSDISVLSPSVIKK